MLRQQVINGTFIRRSLDRLGVVWVGEENGDGEGTVMARV
jgi:hypothetical protein